MGAVTPTIWLQLETQYAIISATFPTIGTFIKSLNTRWGALDGPEVTQYAMEPLSQTQKLSGKRSHAHAHVPSVGPRLRPESPRYSFRVRSPEDIAVEQARSSDDSSQMIIRKTVEMRIEHSQEDF